MSWFLTQDSNAGIMPLIPPANRKLRQNGALPIDPPSNDDHPVPLKCNPWIENQGSLLFFLLQVSPDTEGIVGVLLMTSSSPASQARILTSPKKGRV